MERNFNGYVFSDDKSRLNLEAISDFLINRSYWAKGRTMDQVKRSIENSICIGIYDGDKQIGFARMVTDYAVMYWLCDVYVEEAHRGKGLGKFLVECVVNHPVLQKLNGILATSDAQGLYEKYGFACPTPPRCFMGKRYVSA